MPDPSATPSAGRVRLQLPPLVDRVRILTWFQFYLTLVILAVALVVGGIASGSTRSVVRTDEASRQYLGRVEVLMLVLAATAVLLAISAAVLRRGFAVAYPLTVVAELAVLLAFVLAVRAGVVLIVVTVLPILLTVWIAADVSRRDVRAFMLGSARRG
jgi:hypothetical protein